MSKKQKNETSAKAPVKLTRAEKKEIQAVIRKYKGDGKPHSAQVSIPYEAMYQDGVCRVTPRTFSKCIEFTDISYQLAQADTKTAIFENLCDLYNYLDASIHVQFSFINRKIDPKQYAKSFEIRAQGDDFDDIRSEYSQLLNCENHNSGTMKSTTQELPKSQCNNTDIKNTEFSDTDSIFPSGNGGMMDENDRYQEYFDYFSDQLSIDLLKKDYPYDSEMLDNILELIVETVCTKRPLIRIGAEERPAEIVRSRFMKLNAEHIRYVMDCFKENTTKIRNIRQYMLTTIYNAPTTIDTYYDALVRHDMSHGYLEGGFKKLKMKREEGE